MALFEVPGWSMPTDALPTSSNSRKRKRPGGNANGSEKIQTAEVNIEKLLKKLDSGIAKTDLTDLPKPKKGKKAHQDDERQANDGKQRALKTTNSEGRQETNKKKNKEKKGGVHVMGDGMGSSSKGEDFYGARDRPDGSRNIGNNHSDEHASQTAGKSSQSSKTKRSEKSPKKDQKKREIPAEDTSLTKTQGTSNTTLTALQSKMKQTLDGARFRWINETLYKSDSKDAERLMRDDPKIFEDYHAGFRHQVTSWPTNPVDHFTQAIASSCPARSVIVDLGCGDAALARDLLPKGFTVLSFDLVSTNPFVVAADICERLPLPGAEVDDGEGDASQVVDVVVCSLSLMSTNWLFAVREARRVLKQGGELKIAEVASRFTDVDSFTSVVSSVGFKLKSKDDRNTHFTLFDFKKVKRKEGLDEKQWKDTLSRGSVLQPCEYKRR